MPSRCEEPLSSDPGRVPWTLLVCALTLVAAALRLYGIADWPLRGDEWVTLQDGEKFFTKGSHQYFPAYFFTLWAFFKVAGASALTARLPAALLGIAAIPLFWLLGRRVFGRAITLVALLFITLSEWHIFWSVYARYYTGLFLVGALAALLLYTAVWEQRQWRALGAFALGGLCIALHPSGLLVIAGMTIYVILLLVFPRLGPAQSIKKTALFYLVPLGIAAIPAGYLFVLTMWGWIARGMFRGLNWNYTPIHMALGIVRSVDLTVMLAAFAGVLVCLVWRRRLAVFLLCWAVPGAVLMVLAAPFIDVRPDYIFVLVPAFFFMAATICVVPLEVGAGKARPALVFALALVIGLSQLPAAVSHFTEKKVDDPRVVAGFVKPLIGPGDKVLSYMTGLEPVLGLPTYRLNRGYFDSAHTDWKAGLKEVEQADHRTWIVLWYPRTGVPWQLDEWLGRHAQMMKRWRATRFDYLTRDIEVWLYDPRCTPRQTPGLTGTRP